MCYVCVGAGWCVVFCDCKVLCLNGVLGVGCCCARLFCCVVFSTCVLSLAAVILFVVWGGAGVLCLFCVFVACVCFHVLFDVGCCVVWCVAVCFVFSLRVCVFPFLIVDNSG